MKASKTIFSDELLVHSLKASTRHIKQFLCNLFNYSNAEGTSADHLDSTSFQILSEKLPKIFAPSLQSIFLKHFY